MKIILKLLIDHFFYSFSRFVLKGWDIKSLITKGYLHHIFQIKRLSIKWYSKKTEYLKTLSKLRLTSVPPTQFLINLFLTKC